MDGVGRVTGVRKAGGSLLVTVRPPRSLAEFLTPKGSVAVDGVSLTVAALAEGEFTVALVPHTLGHTTLQDLTRHPKSLHGGSPVWGGEKWACNLWFRQLPYQTTRSRPTGKRPPGRGRR